MTDLWKLAPFTPDHANLAAQRDAWFQKIQPSDNWKLPIDAWIDAPDFENCNQACIWFTGGELVIVERDAARVRVTSGGYYANIGA